ncbi:MAG: flagellar export protein FliJ [Planctomycetia bacterium]|nr:flagellar export protein FliJ [Planctomycetia bacterium]
MAQFKFRLASLHRLREVERDQRRRELAEAAAAVETLARRIAAIDEALRSIAAERATRPGTVDAAALSAADRYAAELRGKRKCRQEEHGAATALVTRRRESLLAADREVRTLERLRDKQRARFVDDQQRREQHALDEAGRIAGFHEAV